MKIAVFLQVIWEIMNGDLRVVSMWGNARNHLDQKPQGFSDYTVLFIM